MAAAGQGPSDAAARWKHGAADRCAALADRIRVAAGRQTGRRKEGDGEVWEKTHEIRHFPTFPYPEETDLVLSGPPNSLRRGRMKKTASTEAAGCRIKGAQDAKRESWLKRGQQATGGMLATTN